MKRLLLLLLLPAFCFGQGDQTIIKVPVDNAGGTENAILHLPDDYSTTSGTYPIIVFLHGVDEGSLTDPSIIYNNSNAGGPAYVIAHGSWPSSFVNPVDKKSYKFIVVSPQAAYGYSTTAPQLENVLTYLLKTYRVDPTRVYLTGLSAGGEGILEYIGKIQASGAAVATTHPIPAFVPMSAVMNAYYRGQYADTIVKNNIQLWGFGSATDVHGANTLNLVLDVNAIKANYALSTAYSGGHCCWGQFYDPAYTLNGMNIYQWLLQYTTNATAVTSPSSPATPTATYYAVPGTVQAENYTTMSGVATETTGDTGGGQDVGWIDNGDWMTYSLNVASAGTYTASFRVASPNAGAAFQVINAAGTVLATVSVPNTGAYQTWQTVTANLTLPVGQQTLTLKSTGTGWNFNWLSFATPSTSTTPPATTTYYAVPGTVQAESYTTMTGVGLETTGDTGGGQDVGWIDAGDAMTYSLNVASAGAYTASFRVASPNAGAAFQILNAAGAVLTTVNVPNTGGYQTWQTITATVTLPAGQQALTIKSTGTGWNFNWLSFATPSVSTPATTYYAVPGTVQAENYSNMSGVGLETTGDTGGGQDVGWIDAGDYMDFQINVATAGTYTIGWRVASPNTGVSFQLLNAAGAVLSTVNVPNTGAYQTWQTVTTQAVLPAGQQTVRVKSTVTGWNFNYMTFAAAPAATVTTYAIPGTVEAEGYASMSGVAQENTLDAGGGYDVGWIDNGDWMKYNVNVATAGSYTVSFRVSAAAAGGQIQLQNASGTALATVTVPASGSYQTWETVTATVTLAAGAQTLIVKSVAAISWNINWIQFTAVAVSVPGVPSIPGTIMAPDYVLMTGVGTEVTGDVGGGTDLGWIDDGDWMNYTVNVTKAGVYTVGFRIATPNNNASLQLLSNGYVVANVLIPNTGAFQTWQTVTTTANLSAGVQTLQVKSTSTAGWNFHYMTFALPTTTSGVTNGLVGATAVGGNVDAAEAAITGADYLTIYPNPVKENFYIQMSNAQAGSLRVQLLDVTGAIRQTQEVTKAAGALQVNVNASTLAPGVYFVRMQIGNWSTVKKIVKQ